MADPAPGAAQPIVADPGTGRACTDPAEAFGQELLADVAELAAFVDAVRGATPPPVGGEDARAALAIALAAAESVRAGRPVRIEEVER